MAYIPLFCGKPFVTTQPEPPSLYGGPALLYGKPPFPKPL